MDPSLSFVIGFVLSIVLLSIVGSRRKRKAAIASLEASGLRLPTRGHNPQWYFVVRRHQSDPWRSQGELDEGLAQLDRAIHQKA